MKRRCIYVTYDSDGTVDDYIGHMLKELHSVTDRIVVVCNYESVSKGMENVKPYADMIIYRPNKGYDAGAYKEALEQIEEIESYDEIVFSNDTFFGPFIPLAEIWDRMEKESCDFWGLNRRHVPMYDFTASFFVVFRKPVISAVIRYIRGHRFECMDRDGILKMFEQGISNYLKKEGYRMGTYCDIGAVDMYRDPDYLINIMGSPVMKKRCFERGYYEEENCRRALRYIEQETKYDISLIRKTVERKYGITFDKEYTDINMAKPDDARGMYYGASEEELEEFLRKNQRIYLYGNGNTAKDFERIYGNRVKILGHIVSEGFREEGMGIASQIEDKNIPVVVALSKENSREVSPQMQEFTNVFYLWKWKERNILQFSK